MYMYVYLYVHTYVCKYSYVCIHIYVYIHICIYVYMNVSIQHTSPTLKKTKRLTQCTLKHAQKHTHTHVSNHTHTHSTNRHTDGNTNRRAYHHHCCRRPLNPTTLKKHNCRRGTYCHVKILNQLCSHVVLQHDINTSK